MALEKHFIQEGVIRAEVENFLRNELNRAGYSGINIQKTPLSTRVILYVEKPPLVIGKKGKRINKLTEILSGKYGLDKPSIDVQKIEEPMLDANIIARRIAVALERGINRRRVVYRAVRSVMGAGGRGIEIILSGKIVGKGGRSRAEKYSQGYMKKSGDSVKLVRIGSTQAYLKAGVIGVTVKIIPSTVVFPDQLSLKTPKKPEEEKKETQEVEAKHPEEKKKEEKAERPKVKKKSDSAPKEKKPSSEESAEGEQAKLEKEEKEELPSSSKLELPVTEEKLLPAESDSSKKEKKKAKKNQGKTKKSPSLNTPI